MASLELNPLKNASSLGFLYILGGIVSLLSAFTAGIDIFALLEAAIRIAVGIGLRKHKLWSIYAIGASAILGLISLFLSPTETTVFMVGLIFVAIDAAIFFWLFSARKSFT